jgi:hypothetical protein
MIKALFLCALCWATTVSAFGQELLKLGPFGKPIQVMDEVGNWSIPIDLYSDPDVEVFIPDITTAGWISWHATQFRQTGIFLVSVFSFYKNDHLCRKERIPVGHETDPKLLEACAALRYQRKLVSIDTRGGIITVLETILMGRDALPDPESLTKMHSTFPLAKAAPKEAYDRMLAIVDREVNHYKGLTIEEAIANDNKVVLNMMHQAYTPANDSGCPGRTREQMANWHNTGCPPLGQTCGYNAQGWFLCSTPAPAEVVPPAQAARDQSTSGNGSRSYSGTVRNTTVDQFINSRDLQQNPEKLKVCMARAGVTEVGEFKINPQYIERVRQYNPDATFVIANDSLAECGMNSGTGKYGPLSWTGENWGWHFIRPEQFKPGIATPEGQNMAIKACGDAAVAKLNRPNFDHYSFFMPREIPRLVTHYTPQQEANLWRGQFHTLTDRGMPVAPYDIEVNGTAFYKNGGLDLAGVSVICLFSPMLEVKDIKTMEVKDSPSSTATKKSR